jgi:hypothetical protein
MYCKWLLLVACFWGQVWQICDKFLSTPTTPTGYPPTSLFLDRDNPKKNIQATNYYKNWGFYLEGVWLWRISDSQKNEYPVCSYEIMTIEIFFRKFLRWY